MGHAGAADHDRMGAPRQMGSARAAAWLNLLAFAMLVAVLVWAPIPLGSNRVWSSALLALWLALALLFALAGAWAGGSAAAAGRLQRAAWPLTLATGFCALVAAQGLWGQADAGVAGLMTLDRFGTVQYLLRSFAFLAMLLTVVLVVDTAQRVRWLLGAVLAAGLLQAVAAVLLLAFGRPYEFLFETFSGDGRATGTFANPDHLAGCMQLALAAGLGLLVQQLGDGPKLRAGWHGRVQGLLAFMMSGKMLFRLLLVLLVVALVMTHSRGGNVAFFTALLVVGGLVAALSRSLRRPALWLVLSMVVVDVWVVGQWVGLDRVVQRLQATAEASSERLASFGLLGTPPPPREESLAGRLKVPRLSLALVPQQPWWGHGGGSYALAFAPIKPLTVYAGLWSHAHNDYVQVAVDTGLVGLGLWLGLGLSAIFVSIPLLRERSSRLNRGVGVAALMALWSFGLHSMVDFNLHITANALALTALLALVWAARALPSRAGQA